MTDVFELRTDFFPLIVMTTKRSLAYADARAIFAAYDPIVRRGERFVSITDVRGSKGVPDSATRAAFAEESKRFEASAQHLAVASALIVESALVRGAITAVQWISKPKIPTANFTAFPPALRWVTERAQESGLVIPSGALELAKIA